ncbi:glycosyltransferase family 2 protein [Pseudomonas sp. 5P_3.1_Bac2]|uniref:glycosyltransferase family 2 protein n=1 Tax=Pseudomonas sp. 5P_3.1_Bac2 TaxID=2971617 RepID=UPI0021C8182F|nr:glycosyltransferase family 2 protein [Pseudomonas sp. 5P_3.1_Bac2]MCU1719140.1 glycosyltransferase family 2 protein [Pseudomonas sp. 5P_3.1_Bac2]
MGKTAAIVVGYRPDIDILTTLLSSLINQVDVLVLVDNGETYTTFSSFPYKERIEYICMGRNAGLGAALNAGFSRAAVDNVEYVVTFDQDSHASSTLISDLVASMRLALEYDMNCIAISPTFFDIRAGTETFFPFYRTVAGKIIPTFKSDNDTGLIQADVLITSGMCVLMSAWLAGAKYDESLFVDFTDTEWCFRVRKEGHTLYGSTKIKMGHALSDAAPIKICGLTFFRYTSVRRYFYFRNTVAILFKPTTPIVWKRRLLKGLVLRFFANIIIDSDKASSVVMMSRGIWHGFRNRLGPWH